MNKEITNLLPYGVKIEWVKDVDRETFIKEDMIIIKMEYHNNNSRNLVNATLNYFSQGLIREARPYIDPKILISIDFTTAKKLFINKQDFGALQYFVDDFLIPFQNKDVELKTNLEIMQILEERGLFSRLLLNELKLLGLKLQPRQPIPIIMDETKRFVLKLHDIVERRRGIDIDTTFLGDFIKVAVVLVGRQETLAYGIEPYINHINLRIQEGYNSIYILSMGQLNIITKQIVNILEKNKNLNKTMEHTYKITLDGRKIDTLCVNIRVLGET